MIIQQTLLIIYFRDAIETGDFWGLIVIIVEVVVMVPEVLDKRNTKVYLIFEGSALFYQ